MRKQTTKAANERSGLLLEENGWSPSALPGLVLRGARLRVLCCPEGNGGDMFSIGDLVVHPMHGAGVIHDIVQEKVAGVLKEYYVFQMPVGGLVLKIPTANSQMIGIRSIVSHTEVCQLLDAIPSLSVESNSNWNKRYQENLALLKSGDLYQVAKVVKGLMHRDSVRGLSTGERKMLHNAKQIMISEIVLVEKEEYRDVETKLDRAMMQVSVPQ